LVKGIEAEEIDLMSAFLDLSREIQLPKALGTDEQNSAGDRSAFSSASETARPSAATLLCPSTTSRINSSRLRPSSKLLWAQWVIVKNAASSG
jgi:hypothetical protein